MKGRPLLIVLVTAAALGVLFVVILALASFLSGSRGTAGPLAAVGGGKVALVKIEGLLVTSEHVVEELNDYADDASIKAIVLRIDSPGGGVVASQEIFNAVKNAKKEGKKIVASMGSVAASGGYYVAAAADKIVANPGTLTGSIGVKMEFANVEKLLEKIGVKGMVVKAGEYKDIGSPFRDMTDQEKTAAPGCDRRCPQPVHRGRCRGPRPAGSGREGHCRRPHLHRTTGAFAQARSTRWGTLRTASRSRGSWRGSRGNRRSWRKRKRFLFSII